MFESIEIRPAASASGRPRRSGGAERACSSESATATDLTPDPTDLLLAPLDKKCGDGRLSWSGVALPRRSRAGGL